MPLDDFRYQDCKGRASVFVCSWSTWRQRYWSSGNAARENRKCLITPRHDFFAVANDEKLNKLLANVDLSFAGVPNTHSMLLPSLSKLFITVTL
jgi:hypothetical protein